ncbi:N-acetylmuramoyl-L-alanine amidase, partial [Bacillus wiedmannii]
KIEAELPVEQNGEQEKKIEQEPSVEQDEKQELKVEQVPQAEESAKTLEVKGNAEQKQAKFLVVIDPGHQEKANLNLEPIGPGAT